MSPRPYQIGERKAAIDKTRERIVTAARGLLVAEDFSSFTMDAVARMADVSRLTVYYQFESKAGLLEALYNHIAARGHIEQLAEVFRHNDAIQKLNRFVEIFVRFWMSDRDVIRRLHALGAIDAEIGKGLRERNERRRRGLRVIVERYCETHPPLQPLQIPVAIDTLQMLTSFETFDALAVGGRSFEEVVEIVCKQCYRAIGFTPRLVSPRN